LSYGGAPKHCGAKKNLPHSPSQQACGLMFYMHFGYHVSITILYTLDGIIIAAPILDIAQRYDTQ